MQANVSVYPTTPPKVLLKLDLQAAELLTYMLIAYDGDFSKEDSKFLYDLKLDMFEAWAKGRQQADVLD